MHRRFAFQAAAIALLAFPTIAFAQDWRDDVAQFELAQANDARTQAIAQERAEAAADEVRAQVYSPEFVMENRREIAMSDRQRQQILTDLQDLQTELISHQMDMEDAREDLIAALRARPANETRVLAALDRVLNIEREIKRAQIRALVHLRDALTPEQRARLDSLRSLD